MSKRIVIGVFQGEREIVAATEAARMRGFSIHDVYTPFAVHGLDRAMGLRRSRLSLVCFLLGLTGLTFALGGQLWTHAWNWPLNIGGKSYTALPALIPITFELTVLFAALGTVFVLFLRCGLRPGKRPRFSFPGVTDDRFVLAIEAEGETPERISAFLKQHQATDIREMTVQ
ncbi:MAG: DUF3341 domain-containing protein [Deltaproteobacteria bacterium]|nr:MAG: DUF3341 domain-containing protein [Deltaproteobacteria bacterium]